MSYTIEFYITKNGEVLIGKFLEKLRKKSKNDKNARIQYRQISLYIELLQRNGVNLNGNIIKHLEDGIWELRPGVNRIFFFYFERARRFCPSCVPRIFPAAGAAGSLPPPAQPFKIQSSRNRICASV